MSELSRIHAFVSGRVQGVGFRYFIEKEAVNRGLSGYARNLYDGRVEIIAEGDRTSLVQFLRVLETGPRMARIDDVDFRWKEHTGEFPDFRITFSSP